MTTYVIRLYVQWKWVMILHMYTRRLISYNNRLHFNMQPRVGRINDDLPYLVLSLDILSTFIISQTATFVNSN